MRFQDVDIPQPVIDAQKQGKLVIFAGAGVSMDAPSDYPSFLNLAEEIGGAAFPKPDKEPVDRYLGRLKQEGLAVHDRVNDAFSRRMVSLIKGASRGTALVSFNAATSRFSASAASASMATVAG